MKRHVYDITITIIIISISIMSMSEVIIKVSWDEIGAGDWGVPGFANAPESYDWFCMQPCQDVEYDVVWEIILPSSEEDRWFCRLWHFSTEELKNRDKLKEIRGCFFFYFLFLNTFVFCLYLLGPFLCFEAQTFMLRGCLSVPLAYQATNKIDPLYLC